MEGSHPLAWLSAARVYCWLALSFLSTRVLESFSPVLLPSASSHTGLFFQPSNRTSDLLLLNFVKLLTNHFSSLSSPLRITALPCFKSPTNLMKIYFIPSSRLLMITVPALSPDRCNPLLVTGHQLRQPVPSFCFICYTHWCIAI